MTILNMFTTTDTITMQHIIMIMITMLLLIQEFSILNLINMKEALMNLESNL